MNIEPNTPTFEFSANIDQARQIGRILCNDCGLHVRDHATLSQCSGISHELASYMQLTTESPVKVA